MKKKLNSILLVDDNPYDNKFHQLIITEMNIADRIDTVLNGEEAIKYLTMPGQTPPELIFLDINMPKVNGWEFLDLYNKLHIKQKAKVVIMILTTSANPDDMEKAKQIEDVNGYETKPLDSAIIEDLLKKYFNEYL